MMMDIWTFLWLLVCLTIFISILVIKLYFVQESIHRRIKERQLMRQELELQRQIQAQQYHVYTLQPFATIEGSRIGSVPTPQQQQFIHEQQELKACNDLPPKYEDVVRSIAINSPAPSYDAVANLSQNSSRPDRY